MGYTFGKPSSSRSEAQREIEAAKRGIRYLTDFPCHGLAIQLVNHFNQFTDQYEANHPRTIKYDVWLDQTYRATTSTLANIAEGIGRINVNQQAQYLRIGKGSGYEALSLCLAAPIPIPDDLITLFQQTLSSLDQSIISIAELRLQSLD